MLKSNIALFCGLFALMCVSGCVNQSTAFLTPGTDLTTLKNFYIIHEEGDQEIDSHIQKNLESRGFTAVIGPALPSPYSADAVVTYTDKWMWDMTMYLLELNIELRSPKDNYPFASGHALHTSLTRKSAPFMVDEVLTNIFNSSSVQGEIKK